MSNDKVDFYINFARDTLYLNYEVSSGGQSQNTVFSFCHQVLNLCPRSSDVSWTFNRGVENLGFIDTLLRYMSSDGPREICFVVNQPLIITPKNTVAQSIFSVARSENKVKGPDIWLNQPVMVRVPDTLTIKTRVHARHKPSLCGPVSTYLRATESEEIEVDTNREMDEYQKQLKQEMSDVIYRHRWYREWLKVQRFFTVRITRAADHL